MSPFHNDVLDVDGLSVGQENIAVARGGGRPTTYEVSSARL